MQRPTREAVQRSRTMFVLKQAGQSFRKGDKVFANHETPRAADTLGKRKTIDCDCVGVCDADAAADDFAVAVRLPVNEAKALRTVECVDTGRKTDAGEMVVVAFQSWRQFTPTDEPINDRCPVGHMVEMERADKREAKADDKDAGKADDKADRRAK